MSRVVKRLGAFHIACTLLAVIGKRFRDAGLEDIIIESEIIGIGSVNGSLLGKHYNRGIRLQKIVGEALFRLKWEAFCNWLQEKNHQTDQFQTIAARINCTSKGIFALVSEDEFIVLYDLFKEFSSSMETSMSRFWQSYPDMVSLLLAFIRSTREGEWNLHLEFIREMMKWFHAYDRTNYARYLPQYWAAMKAHQKFLQGEFSVQISSVRGFSQTAVDQTVEQTVNKLTKTEGEIIGFSLKKGAVQRWFITAHERASFSLKLKEMLCLNTNEDDIHKEFRAPRLAKDENGVERVMSIIKGQLHSKNKLISDEMQKNEPSLTSMRQMVLEISHSKVRNLSKMEVAILKVFSLILTQI